VSRVVAFFDAESNSVTGVSPVVPGIYEATGALHNRAILDPFGLGSGWDWPSLHQAIGVWPYCAPYVFPGISESLSEGPGIIYGPVGVPELWALSAAEEAVTETADTSERLAFARAQLSLNVTQLAGVLRVTRQTVYDWLTREGKARSEQLARIKAVYDVAREWNRVSRAPVGELLVTPVLDGISLIEALRVEALDIDRIRAVLRILRETMLVRDALPQRQRAASEVASDRGYAIPDPLEQQRRRDSAVRRVRRSR
jgi:transcriptional regulator with XRE-family HTH domain